MLDYFKTRGLNQELINRFELKEKEKFVMMPYYGQDKKFLFNKCRSKYSKKFWYDPGGGSLTLYNFWNLSGFRDYVVITEGEIDCLTLIQFGINSVGSPGAGLFSKNWIEHFSNIPKIYVAYDNDGAGIEGARKLSEKIFSTREIYNILVPREGGAKDINDLLVKLRYGRDDFIKLIKQSIKYRPTEYEVNKKEKEEKKPEERVTRFTTGDHMGEIYYCKEDSSGGFMVYERSTGKIEKKDKFEQKKKVYIPDIDSELIKTGVVRIPSKVLDHGSTEKLLDDMHTYLNKYVDINDEIDRDIVLTYVLLTWVYDRFSSIPYLRVIGNYGSGKSRLLKVLNICNKSIYTSGNASEAPIFRLMHKYGGTLIIDEAELSKNSKRSEGVKEILRFGKDRGGVVARCDGVNFEVKAYRVFGPKILGSRYSYSDDALESRIISIHMKETKADHIPLNLDLEEFDRDSEEIRSKLLSWYFKNYHKVDTKIYKKYIDTSISKRLNEMNSPLICIRHWDRGFVEGLIVKSKERHLSLMENKSLSLEANIIKSISN